MTHIHISKILSLLCILGFLTACGNLSSNIIDDQATLDHIYKPTHDLHALTDSLAMPLINDGTDSGIVVAILDENGQKHTFGYGTKDVEVDAPPDGRTIFAVGSLTKSFTTLLLYELIKDGTLRADETVGEILPREVDFSPAAKQVTLYQLANHASGMPRQPNDLAMVDSLINYSFTGENIYRHMDKDELYNYLKTFDPDPNDIGKYRYSNIGAGLLGHLIEVKTGKTLPALMKQKFFTPLGLQDTAYGVSLDHYARLAQGHVGDSPYFVSRGTPIPPWYTFDIMKGMAGIYSTSDDLLKFAQFRMQLRDVPIVKESADSGIFGSNKFQYVSFGWSVDKFDNENTEIIFQHGMIAGYSAYMGINQKKGIAVIVLCNSFNWDDHIGHNLLLTLSRNSGKSSATTE